MPVIPLSDNNPLFSIIKFRMGAQIEKPQLLDLSDHEPDLSEYQLKQCIINCYLWQHEASEDSLLQFPITDPNVGAYVEMYLLRHRSNVLVSSMFFRRNCNTHKSSIFYEKVYTNLSRLNDLPFQDSLQFYFVALKGFGLLFRKFGYFQVHESMFHITRGKQAKVWLSKDISQLRPAQSASPTADKPEAAMIKRILSIIWENTYQPENSVQVGKMLLQAECMNFESITQKFRQICRQYKLTIPDKLTCLDYIKDEAAILYLDEYSQKVSLLAGEMGEGADSKLLMVEGQKQSRLLASLEPIIISEIVQDDKIQHGDEERGKSHKGLSIFKKSSQFQPEDRHSAQKLTTHKTGPPTLVPPSVAKQQSATSFHKIGSTFSPSNSNCFTRSAQSSFHTVQSRAPHSTQKPVFTPQATLRQSSPSQTHLIIRRPQTPTQSFPQQLIIVRQSSPSMHAPQVRFTHQQKPLPPGSHPQPHRRTSSTIHSIANTQINIMPKPQCPGVMQMLAENQEQVARHIRQVGQSGKENGAGKVNKDQTNVELGKKQGRAEGRKTDRKSKIGKICYNRFNNQRELKAEDKERDIPVQTSATITIIKPQNQETTQIPSITNLSENASSLPPNDKVEPMVPAPKTYQPKIDREIWQDMLKIRSRPQKL